MSYGDIRSHMKKMYGTELSDAQLSHVTNSVSEEMEQWRNRPLTDQLAICLFRRHPLQDPFWWSGSYRNGSCGHWH